MHVTYVSSHKEAKNLRTFFFRPDKPVRYSAGQFTEIRLEHEHTDDRGDKRWFTISSSPTDELVSITTRLDPKRPSSFKKALFSMGPGTKLTLADPMGDFVLPLKKDIPLVFVAAGIGVTPMHSMIRYIVDKDETRDITLLYAAAHLDEVAFRKEFEGAPISFEIMLEHPSTGWKGKQGRLSSDLITKLPGVQEKALVYISGAEPMVRTFYEELQTKGVDRRRLVIDEFPGYTTV